MGVTFTGSNYDDVHRKLEDGFNMNGAYKDRFEYLRLLVHFFLNGEGNIKPVHWNGKDNWSVSLDKNINPKDPNQQKLFKKYVDFKWPRKFSPLNPSQQQTEVENLGLSEEQIRKKVIEILTIMNWVKKQSGIKETTLRPLENMLYDARKEGYLYTENFINMFVKEYNLKHSLPTFDLALKKALDKTKIIQQVKPIGALEFRGDVKEKNPKYNLDIEEVKDPNKRVVLIDTINKLRQILQSDIKFENKPGTNYNSFINRYRELYGKNKYSNDSEASLKKKIDEIYKIIDKNMVLVPLKR
jgi:hypothetical protein